MADNKTKELFEVAPHSFTLKDLLAEAERELKMRNQVFPRRVAAGSMRHATATWQIQAMEAIRDLLQRQIDGKAEP